MNNTMTESNSARQDQVAAAFAAATVERDDERRIRRVIRRIHTEIASRDGLLFLFVRLWLTALELGSALYAARPLSKSRKAAQAMLVSSSTGEPR